MNTQEIAVAEVVSNESEVITHVDAEIIPINKNVILDTSDENDNSDCNAIQEKKIKNGPPPVAVIKIIDKATDKEFVFVRKYIELVSKHATDADIAITNIKRTVLTGSAKTDDGVIRICRLTNQEKLYTVLTGNKKIIDAYNRYELALVKANGGVVEIPTLNCKLVSVKHLTRALQEGQDIPDTSFLSLKVVQAKPFVKREYPKNKRIEQKPIPEVGDNVQKKPYQKKFHQQQTSNQRTNEVSAESIAERLKESGMRISVGKQKQHK